MPGRPLRQYYADDRTLEIVGLPGAVKPFVRQRARFLDALASLTDEAWTATTRCDAWNAKDVCNHLVTADGFWSLTLAGRGAAEPTTFLRGFDPTKSPDSFIEPMRYAEPGAILESLRSSTEKLAEALGAIGEDEWALRSESPMGHVPVSVIAAHSMWDSWLHERDILVPLGQTPPVEDDELLTSVAFTMFLGGAQGGVLDDPTPVGEGPEQPIDVAVAFDDLPDRSVRLTVDQHVSVSVEPSNDSAPDAGSAVEFVEAITGRAPADSTLERLPEALKAQLERARHIL